MSIMNDELEYEYLEQIDQWRCFQPTNDWVWMSGFGKTKPEAYMQFVTRRVPIKVNPNSVVAVRVTA